MNITKAYVQITQRVAITLSRIKKQKISTRNINNIKNRKPAWLKKPIKRCSTSLVFDVLSIETSFILCIILEIIKSLTVLSIGEKEGKQAPRLTASRSAK